jgi:hypothetical protein
MLSKAKHLVLKTEYEDEILAGVYPEFLEGAQNDMRNHNLLAETPS